MGSVAILQQINRHRTPLTHSKRFNAKHQSRRVQQGKRVPI